MWRMYPWMWDEDRQEQGPWSPVPLYCGLFWGLFGGLLTYFISGGHSEKLPYAAFIGMFVLGYLGAKLAKR